MNQYQSERMIREAQQRNGWENTEHPTFTAGLNQQFAADRHWSMDNYYPGERTMDFRLEAIEEVASG